MIQDNDTTRAPQRADSSPSPRSPVAWLHIFDNTEGIDGNTPIKRLTFSPEHPFGVAGLDFSAEFQITTHPLYLANSDSASPVKY